MAVDASDRLESGGCCGPRRSEGVDILLRSIALSRLCDSVRCQTPQPRPVAALDGDGASQELEDSRIIRVVHCAY